MFAFALWDANTSTLFLARDRLGKKPLYYAPLPDGRVLFASELKSLLEDPTLPRALDTRAVEDYFALGYVPDPRSILRGVYKLPPAHTLVWQRGATQPQPRGYWDVACKPVAIECEQAAAAELIDRLREATRIRLISEVPLGAFLSGGVDSSGVVAMMAGLSTEPVKTCSISFGDPRYNESTFAEAVARRYQTNHHVDRVDADDFDLLDTLARAYDEPFADSSAIPTYRVCQLARRQVTVALSGDGGDECFAGYRRYRWHMNEERVRQLLPASLRRGLFGLLGSVYPKLDRAPRLFRAKATLQGIARDSVEGYLHSVSIMTPELRSSIYSRSLTGDLAGYSVSEVFHEHAARAPTDDPLGLVQYLDFKTYLPGDILTKVDRASMAHALEVRVPMLDYTFVDWVSGLQPQLKLRNGAGKYLLKKSLEPHVPHEVMYRPKMGFAVPIANWFRGPLRDRLRLAVRSDVLAASGLFDPAALSTLAEAHIRGSRDHSAALWALLMFDASVSRLLGGGRPA
jgi:asparagine synthase (glutamine-hydrolysing)